MSPRFASLVAAASYKKAALQARNLWSSQPDAQEQLIRSFVKGCLVFACIKVIERDAKAHVPAFGERVNWSSGRGHFLAPTLDKPLGDDAIDEGGEGGNPNASTPPLSDDDDLDFTIAPQRSMNSVSINDLYAGSGELSPIKNLSFHDSKRSGEIDGQENFWNVIGRVFRAPPSKAYKQPEIVVEEEVRRLYSHSEEERSDESRRQ